MRYTNSTGNVPKCPVLLPRVPGVFPLMKGGTPSDDCSNTWQDVVVSVAGSSNALFVRLNILNDSWSMFWSCFRLGVLRSDALANLAIFIFLQWCRV